MVCRLFIQADIRTSAVLLSVRPLQTNLNETVKPTNLSSQENACENFVLVKSAS